MFFLPKWKEKGVVFIHDVLDNCGKILSFNTFQTKFNVKSNFLNYLQVVSAIPKHLLQKSRSLSKRNRFKEDNTTFQLSPLLSIDLSKMKSKDYYWLYINATTVKATGPKNGKES